MPDPRPRLSFQALQAVDKFRFIERDRAYCEEWRRMMDQLMSENDISRDGFLNMMKASKCCLVFHCSRGS